MRKHQGIRARHARPCASHAGGKCNCQPSYEAFVSDRRNRRKIRRTFARLAEAKSWRADALRAVERGTLAAPSRTTLEEKARAWLDGAAAGTILSKRRTPYKPSALRSYRRDLEAIVFPELGAHRLSEIRRVDVQALVDRLIARRLSGSRVRNIVVPVQAIYAHAIRRNEVGIDPTDNLELPEAGGTRNVEVEPERAAELISALPEDLRALFACAFYAGPRRGELRALRVSDVHGLDGEGDRYIAIERSMDDVEGEIAPKSKAGVRLIPLPEILRAFLIEHVERTGRSGDDLLFGRTASLPFTPTRVRKRADDVWTNAGMERVTPQECRHAAKTFMDAARISESRADRYLGHNDGTVANRYRHRLMSQVAEDAKRLDEYLVATTTGKVVPLRTGAPRRLDAAAST